MTSWSSAAAVGAALTGGGGKILIVVLVTIAIVALVIAFVLVFGRDRESVESRLAGYTYPEGDESAAPGTAGESEGLAETRVVRQAVDLTSALAERAGLLARVERLLEQGDLPLRPAEALFFYLAGVVITALFLVIVAPSLPIALGLTVILAIIPPLQVVARRRKRLRAFEEQLPDTLNLLAGSLRAGFSFVQGLEAVSQEAGEPTRRELSRVFTETRLGRNLEDALEDAAERMNSTDLGWAVMAIRIQREVGGNLAELLDTVADTMQQRERLRREIKALTAEGRFSGIVLGIFPFGFGGLLYMVAPDYIGKLFADFTGKALVVVAAVMALAGFAWLRKIVTIEV